MRSIRQSAQLPYAVLLLALTFASFAIGPPAHSQTESGDKGSDPGATQCGVYIEAYKTGAQGYTPYLDYTKDLARRRDSNDPNKTYTTALQHSAPAANALWLSNWCSKSPLKPFAGAANYLLAELTGASGEETNKATSGKNEPSTNHPLVVVIPGNQSTPNSCRVGGTKYCSGCSVGCEEGTKARCMIGTDSYFEHDCLQPAVCRCK